MGAGMAACTYRDECSCGCSSADLRYYWLVLMRAVSVRAEHVPTRSAVHRLSRCTLLSGGAVPCRDRATVSRGMLRMCLRAWYAMTGTDTADGGTVMAKEWVCGAQYPALTWRMTVSAREADGRGGESRRHRAFPGQSPVLGRSSVLNIRVAPRRNTIATRICAS